MKQPSHDQIEDSDTQTGVTGLPKDLKYFGKIGRDYARIRFKDPNPLVNVDGPEQGTSIPSACSGSNRDLVEFMTAIGIPCDGTVLHAGTPQEITGESVWTAVSELISDLKKAGLWEQAVAIFPYVGGTGETHKFNLKSPHNSNSSKRIVFSGVWKHSPTGATPVGNSHADTFIRLSDDVPQYSFTGATYFRNMASNRSNAFYPFVTVGSEQEKSVLSMRLDADGNCLVTAGTTSLGFGPSLANPGFSGLITMTCFRDNMLRLYRKGTLLASETGSRSFYFDRRRPMDSLATLYLSKPVDTDATIPKEGIGWERSFDYFGNGMDTADQARLEKAVAVFQAALKRKD